jgi:hypothetical protein
MEVQKDGRQSTDCMASHRRAVGAVSALLCVGMPARRSSTWLPGVYPSSCSHLAGISGVRLDIFLGHICDCRLSQVSNNGPLSVDRQCRFLLFRSYRVQDRTGSSVGTISDNGLDDRQSGLPSACGYGRTLAHQACSPVGRGGTFPWRHYSRLRFVQMSSGPAQLQWAASTAVNSKLVLKPR